MERKEEGGWDLTPRVGCKFLLPREMLNTSGLVMEQERRTTLVGWCPNFFHTVLMVYQYHNHVQ